MSAFRFSNKVIGAQAQGAYTIAKRRWIHNNLRRQAIMMPAMSPLMNEGTVTNWKVKEGEAFAAGDVLLQIEWEMSTIDVEANCPGILGKILVPDGTPNVAVEDLLAIVARDQAELRQLEHLSPALPTPPPFNLTPIPPSQYLASSPLSMEFKSPLMTPRARTPRTPSLFEMQTMGYGHRGLHSTQPRSAVYKYDTDIETPPCPSARIQHLSQELPPTPMTATWPLPSDDTIQADGDSLRRMIMANLAAQQARKSEEHLDDLI